MIETSDSVTPVDVEESDLCSALFSACGEVVLMTDGAEAASMPTVQDEAAILSEEQTLVEKAKQDAEAFGELYRRYVRRIYNYHYRHTRNHVEAEDLTSRTFYSVLRGIRHYKDRGISFQAWLFRIAHNLVVNWYRDQSRHPLVPLEVVETHGEQGMWGDEPHEQFVHAERQALVQRLIERLPEERKTLLILKFVEKMPNEEIAKVLGKTEGAVKSLYHRILLDLREIIRQGELSDDLYEEKVYRVRAGDFPA